MTSAHPEERDPRTVPAGEGERSSGILPVVDRPKSGLPGWAIFALAVLAAIILFLVLDSGRRSPTAPATRAEIADGAATASLPELYLPEAPIWEERVVVRRAAPAAPEPPPTAAPAPQVVFVRQPSAPITGPVVSAAPVIRGSPEATLVYDRGAPAASLGSSGASGPGDASRSSQDQMDGVVQSGQSPSRVRASMFANRGTTVSQGALIPAVLETALDSTRSGLARAVVAQDVRGFDGTRILIPRGSRLIGEYRSEVAAGQKRALVNWTRLIRPDGVTVAIGSPATDRLGGGGIPARVNSHFFQRFAGAILQSALDIGVNLASRRAGDDTVFVLPGGLTGSVQVIQPDRITPTLKVREGTRISVFVARDLDFSAVDDKGS